MDKVYFRKDKSTTRCNEIRCHFLADLPDVVTGLITSQTEEDYQEEEDKGIIYLVGLCFKTIVKKRRLGPDRRMTGRAAD